MQSYNLGEWGTVIIQLEVVACHCLPLCESQGVSSGIKLPGFIRTLDQQKIIMSNDFKHKTLRSLHVCPIPEYSSDLHFSGKSLGPYL